jgi:lipopolysaccharide/colanic/teichoic acid biosynthesis glycosyltransferase
MEYVNRLAKPLVVVFPIFLISEGSIKEEGIEKFLNIRFILSVSFPNVKHSFASEQRCSNSDNSVEIIEGKALGLEKKKVGGVFMLLFVVVVLFVRFVMGMGESIFAVLFFLTIGIFIFPIIALIIKLTSRGPIIFKQERWGLNNQKITCFKFRSMIKESSDIDEGGNYNQAFKNDPRITLIGKFLRQTNLDELPQFWNVLLGNMSVVGPRPHPTPLNIESMQTVDNYMLRHMVLPGITGLAQVNGCRGETKTTQEMQRRVNFDLYYIHRWSFWLDLQIIIQTVVNIFRGDQNAY